MLAPITRLELIAGKLLGAMAIPVLFHLGFVGASELVIGRLEVLAPYSPARRLRGDAGDRPPASPRRRGRSPRRRARRDPPTHA